MAGEPASFSGLALSVRNTVATKQGYEQALHNGLLSRCLDRCSAQLICNARRIAWFVGRFPKSPSERATAFTTCSTSSLSTIFDDR